MTCSVLFKDLDKIKQQLHTFGHSEKNSSLSNFVYKSVCWLFIMTLRLSK